MVPPQPERTPELAAAQDASIGLALRHPDPTQAVRRVLAMFGIASLRDAPAGILPEIAATAEAVVEGLNAGKRHSYGNQLIMKHDAVPAALTAFQRAEEAIQSIESSSDLTGVSHWWSEFLVQYVRVYTKRIAEAKCLSSTA